MATTEAPLDIVDEPCKHIAAALLAGKLDAIEEWACPECGEVFRCELVGNVRRWRAVPITAVISESSSCGWCRSGTPQEPGAHHAANCPLYRSPFVGPDAALWDRKLRERPI